MIESRRVRRPKAKDEIIDELTSKGPFATIRDLLGFAASLGFYHGRAEPFDETGEQVPWQVFVNQPSNEYLVAMIALAEIGEVSVLRSDQFDNRLRIFEAYANGGLSILEQRLRSTSQSTLDVVSDLIREVHTAEEDRRNIGDLADIADDLTRSLRDTDTDS